VLCGQQLSRRQQQRLAACVSTKGRSAEEKPEQGRAGGQEEDSER
jgi:hypothetical protein